MANEWYKRKRDEMNKQRYYCENPMCRSFADEWCHLEFTGLKGVGRGRTNRILDWIRHPESYARLCKRCHALLDRRKVYV